MQCFLRSGRDCTNERVDASCWPQALARAGAGSCREHELRSASPPRGKRYVPLLFTGRCAYVHADRVSCVAMSRPQNTTLPRYTVINKVRVRASKLGLARHLVGDKPPSPSSCPGYVLPTPGAREGPSPNKPNFGRSRGCRNRPYYNTEYQRIEILNILFDYQ